MIFVKGAEGGFSLDALKDDLQWRVVVAELSWKVVDVHGAPILCGISSGPRVSAACIAIGRKPAVAVFLVDTPIGDLRVVGGLVGLATIAAGSSGLPVTYPLRPRN